MSPTVLGPTVDEQTRCIHYRTALDIVAIRFACCGDYYPCHRCHEQAADHPSRPWPPEAGDERAVLCGSCREELTIAQYVASTHCPACGAAFNPRCALHHPMYFELPA
ncbi:zinc finger CHY domain protein [Xylanimonas cellulosilytica DSM 15894]|uniref:Zinc finger CHY domain protein n=1 Tax=Xylanimonas cellulosilytica (strain DSM 15894 / JCM 12276 / CECT 5975 / KCTC 9989 / LMG 20990 / NBRC 107835 / XIL07) TaxID=446471 RepID=D1BZV0_XYLCX|nr:CHY zinc finger protein [Xylanimonas cellulosilytica]ACZ32078.1 zinc finger CHY domain protein [Xylanimonas cellulosilytica DSM 15894]